MSSNECSYGIPIIWSVVFSLTKSINDNDAHSNRYLSQPFQLCQRFKNTLDQSLTWIDVASGPREMVENVDICLENMMIWGQLWTLWQLCCQTVDKLGHMTSGTVVTLAKVVTNNQSGKIVQIVFWLCLCITCHRNFWDNNMKIPRPELIKQFQRFSPSYKALSRWCPKQLLSTKASMTAVLPLPGPPAMVTPLLVGRWEERCSLISCHNHCLPTIGDGAGWGTSK